ncbi:MAG: MalY/PatB family protein [Cellulosilyticaceae bacterium]
MGEKNLDFDRIIDRSGTNSLKYDFAGQRGKPCGILPLWVADMDFKTSSYIIEALEQMSRHGIYGYSESMASYFETLQKWTKKHYDWEIEEEWLVKTPGIVYALGMAIRAYTEIGESVLIQEPVYYPFKEVIQSNKRNVVIQDLYQEADGRYAIDFEAFEHKIITEHVKLFILCSPHNPVGRVWTETELTQIGEICLRHGVIVVSDEIHADFTFKARHRVFTSIKKDFEKIGIVCMSPSKSFNVAGLQVSHIFIANPNLRRRLSVEIEATGYSQLNMAGLVACEAAYRDGEQWLAAVKCYIKGNMDYVRQFCEENMPRIKVVDGEGTYLMWLDFRAYGMSDKALDEKIIYEAGLWLDRGTLFGSAGTGFQRMNVACPRSTIIKAMEKLQSAFEGL